MMAMATLSDDHPCSRHHRHPRAYCTIKGESVGIVQRPPLNDTRDTQPSADTRLRMAHPLITRNFKTRVSGALEMAASASEANHPGLVGEIREILIEEILRPVLPPGVDVGTGKIIDHAGGTSDQVDIVIYDEGSLPPWIYGRANLGIYPVESALYMIEVKSRVTSAEVRDFLKKANSVRRLQYMTEYRTRFASTYDRVTPCLFGFSSDLVGDQAAELQRLLEERIAPSDVLPVACVVGRGYWFYSHRPFHAIGGPGWVRMRGQDAVDEILAWIAGVANSIPQKSAQRRGLPFGNYLIATTTHSEPA